MASMADPNSDPVYRMRWWLVASVAAMLCLAVAFGVARRQHWNWALFLWGLAVGVLQLAFLELNVAMLKRFVQVPAFGRERHVRRRPIYLLLGLELGVIFGAAAAGF